MNIPTPLLVIIVLLLMVGAVLIIAHISEKRDAVNSPLWPKCENKACRSPSRFRVSSSENPGAMICQGCAWDELERERDIRHATHSH